MFDQVLVICGPTAVGKTQLALSLAKKFNGDILAADSRQVYQGLDIGTGKDLPPGSIRIRRSISGLNQPVCVYEYQSICLWGLDIVPANLPFSAADYRLYSQAVIQAIWARHRLPILTVGTGFYLKSLFSPPPSLGVSPNLKLRQTLEGKSVFALQARLQLEDPSRFNSMNPSDRANPRRLVRAIEVSLGKKPKPALSPPLSFKSLYLGMNLPPPILEAQINQRVLGRASTAFTQELKALYMKYPDFPHSQAATATGYREWLQYLSGELSRKEAVSLWQLHERQYSRRQLTWFKKIPGLNWFEVSNPSWEASVVQLVNSWYS